MSRIIIFVFAFHVVTWAMYETPQFLREHWHLSSEMGE